MKPFRFVPALLASLLIIAACPAHATTYPGNGNSNFGGNLGEGSLTVTNDGSGGLDFAFALDGTSSLSPSASPNNSIVIYIDNSTGGGIGTSTSGMNDTSNGATVAISEYGGTGDQSTLNFGGLMNPQYGISLSDNNAIDYKLVDGGSLTFTDNADVGTTSGNGETYSISGNTWSVDLPAVDFGLSSFSGNTVKFVAIEVSQTGYSSNEATGSLTGNNGYGNTQTMTSVNTFTAASVPEGSSTALLGCGAGALVLLCRGRRVRL
jgi:hypothetical protein